MIHPNQPTLQQTLEMSKQVILAPINYAVQAVNTLSQIDVKLLQLLSFLETSFAQVTEIKVEKSNSCTGLIGKLFGCMKYGVTIYDQNDKEIAKFTYELKKCQLCCCFENWCSCYCSCTCQNEMVHKTQKRTILEGHLFGKKAKIINFQFTANLIVDNVLLAYSENVQVTNKNCQQHFGCGVQPHQSYYSRLAHETTQAQQVYLYTKVTCYDFWCKDICDMLCYFCKCKCFSCNCCPDTIEKAYYNPSIPMDDEVDVIVNMHEDSKETGQRIKKCHQCSFQVFKLNVSSIPNNKKVLALLNGAQIQQDRISSEINVVFCI